MMIIQHKSNSCLLVITTIICNHINFLFSSLVLKTFLVGIVIFGRGKSIIWCKSLLNATKRLIFYTASSEVACPFDSCQEHDGTLESL